MSWSNGKDSALALHVARHQLGLDVVGLLTTVNASADRVAMHAVRRSLLDQQAASLGLPLHVVHLPWPCSNDVYEQQMTAALDAARDAQVEAMVFGDLFLEDIRAYREAMLAGTGIVPVFPLWREPTSRLSQRMLDEGIRALVTCVDPQQAPSTLAGCWYDHDFLAKLPAKVDPCGERG
jgi:diphthamide synthase (EF-2-diphthine--ammonia ligase)